MRKKNALVIWDNLRKTSDMFLHERSVILCFAIFTVLINCSYYFLKNTSNKKRSLGIEILGLVIVLMIDGLTTNYTNVLSVTGGGGKLFWWQVRYICLKNY